MKTKLLLFFAICLSAWNMNAQVSITGEAVGGWGDGFDFDMTTTDGVNWTYTGLTCATFATDGGIKFRLDHAWATNWGDIAFPEGIGTLNGPNIRCIAGTYDVEFNSETGVYRFIGGTPLPIVKLIGTSVTEAGGLTMSPTSPTSFKLTNVTLLDGTGQFSVEENGNTSIFGETLFPDGVLNGNSDNIPVVAGTYSSVTLDLFLGTYSFVAAPVFPVISITGSAVGGWGDGFDFNMTTTDGIIYKYNALPVTVDATNFELKFRTNNNWTDPNYGGAGWPTGIATTTGPNIAATASGFYDVTFNLTTGEYTFSFPLISLTGDAFGGWGDGFDFDLATTDGGTYTVPSITAVATNGAKFRSNHNWTDPNYGSTTFPAGTALATTGDNIPVVAGTYSVTFNRVTGAFMFDVPFATTTFNSANFKVYPNPTQNVWNFTSVKQAIESIQIVDVLGKTVMTITPKDMTATVDASSLTSGLYFAKISTANATETAKLMKN